MTPSVIRKIAIPMHATDARRAKVRNQNILEGTDQAMWWLEEGRWRPGPTIDR